MITIMVVPLHLTLIGLDILINGHLQAKVTQGQVLILIVPVLSEGLVRTLNKSDILT